VSDVHVVTEPSQTAKDKQSYIEFR